MDKRTLVLCLLTATAALPVPACASEENPRPGIEFEVPSEEYEVYSAVLNETEGPSELVIVEELTDDAKEYRANLFALKAPARFLMLADFRSKNSRVSKLEENFSVPGRVLLISRHELNDLFSDPDGGWGAFYRKYPQTSGIITLSRVGFNWNHTRALLYYGNWFDYLGGRGHLIHLVKKKGEWVIKAWNMVWFS
jgi:hypothetical protein